jgi:hypothetical protein
MNMLGTICHVQQQFRFGIHFFALRIKQDGTYLIADYRAARLPCGDTRIAFFFEKRHQVIDLSGLPGAFDSFESNKHRFLNNSGFKGSGLKLKFSGVGCQVSG